MAPFAAEVTIQQDDVTCKFGRAEIEKRADSEYNTSVLKRTERGGGESIC